MRLMQWAVVISCLTAAGPTTAAQQFVAQWDVGPVLTCTVSETGAAHRERQLVIKDGNKLLARLTDLSRVIAIYPTRDVNGLLVTVWQGGSAYHVRAFVYRDARVVQVMDAGTYFFPELLDVDGDGSPELLIRETGGQLAPDARLLGTKIVAYKWDGKKFPRFGRGVRIRFNGRSTHHERPSRQHVSLLSCGFGRHRERMPVGSPANRTCAIA